VLPGSEPGFSLMPLKIAGSEMMTIEPSNRRHQDAKRRVQSATHLLVRVVLARSALGRPATRPHRPAPPYRPPSRPPKLAACFSVWFSLITSVLGENIAG